MRKLFRVGALLMVAALVLTIVGGVSAQDEPKILRTDIGASDVPTIDPAISTDASSIQILEMTYIGLTFIAEDSSTQLGMATAFETVENDDGSATHTFTLLEGVPWVRYNAEWRTRS